jgi:hypothetical protein
VVVLPGVGAAERWEGGGEGLRIVSACLERGNEL